MAVQGYAAPRPFQLGKHRPACSPQGGSAEGISVKCVYLSIPPLRATSGLKANFSHRENSTAFGPSLVSNFKTPGHVYITVVDQSTTLSSFKLTTPNLGEETLQRL